MATFWTRDKINKLKELSKNKSTISEMSVVFGKSIPAIKAQCVIYGIKTRSKTGSRIEQDNIVEKLQREATFDEGNMIKKKATLIRKNLAFTKAMLAARKKGKEKFILTPADGTDPILDDSIIVQIHRPVLSSYLGSPAELCAKA